MNKKIDLEKDSPAIAQEKLEHFKKLFPEAISEGKVDVEALRRSLGENVASSDERYNLNWAGKTEAFKALQTPTIATLAPCPEESIDFDKTGNVFIEGENLEVLKVLQKAYYGKIKMIYIDPPYNTGSDSFIYPDRFQESKEDYLKRIEEKDEEGYLLKEGLFRKNSKENGHYHSNWLSMMYPRLFLARNLLRDDGVIFVSIDDNEVHNLRLLMNEVFGEENHVATMMIVNNMKGRNDKANVATCHEYLLIYSKEKFESYGLPLTDAQLRQYKYSDENGEKYDLRDLRKRGRPDRRADRPKMYFAVYYNKKTGKCSLERESKEDIEILPRRGDGSDGRWRWGVERVSANLKYLHPRYSVKNDRWDIEHRVYLNSNIILDVADEEVDDDEQDYQKTSKPKSFWWGGEISTDVANREFKKLIEDINPDYPKSPFFIERLVHMGTKPGDIILDFFSGYSTTAHAILNINSATGAAGRKFILVQLSELCDEKSESYKANYKTIAEIGKERIRRVIKKIKYEIKDKKDLFSKEKPNFDLGLKVFKLKNSNFKIWRGDVVDNAEDLERQMDLLKDPVKPEAQEQNLLWELLLKSGYDLNTKIIEQKVGKCRFYSVAGGEMAVILGKADEKCLQEIVKLKPQKVICLDNIFQANDQLKTNTALQMKDAGIEFRTI